MDPAEIRRMNFLQPGEFPLTTPTGANYDSRRVREGARRGAAGVRLRRAARRAGAPPQPAATRSSSASASRSYVEVTAPVGLHVEFGAVEIHDDGTASVFAGTSVHGQGHHTAFAMLASDVLGIPMDKITLVNSDTDRVPRGAGTMGSRSLQTAGSAVHVASNEVLDRAKQDRRATCSKRRPTTSSSATAACTSPACRPSALSWAELAVASRDASKLPERPRAGAAAPRARLRRHRLDVPVRRARLGRRGRHRDRRGHDAPPRRRRRLRTHPQPAARRRPAARRHRPGRRAGAVRVDAVRRGRQPAHVEPRSTTPSRRRPSSAASRCPTPRPTARATRSARRASASRARSARRPPSRTRSSTRVSHLGVTHIDMPCTAERVLAGDPGRFRLSGGHLADVWPARTQPVNASIPSMSRSNRIDRKRSNECCAPGSSTYTTGFADTSRTRATSSRCRLDRHVGVVVAVRDEERRCVGTGQPER